MKKCFIFYIKTKYIYIYIYVYFYNRNARSLPRAIEGGWAVVCYAMEFCGFVITFCMGLKFHWKILRSMEDESLSRSGCPWGETSKHDYEFGIPWIWNYTSLELHKSNLEFQGSGTTRVWNSMDLELHEFGIIRVESGIPRVWNYMSLEFHESGIT